MWMYLVFHRWQFRICRKSRVSSTTQRSEIPRREEEFSTTIRRSFETRCQVDRVRVRIEEVNGFVVDLFIGTEDLRVDVEGA